MKHTFTIILLFAFIGSNAQNFKLTYSETLDLSDKLQSIDDPAIRKLVMDQAGQPKMYELISCNGTSIYQKISNDEEDKNITISGGEDIFYKNHNKKLLFQQTNFMSRTFLIEDKLEKNNWEITNETIKIGNYTCQKATLKQGQSIITAWFTSEIPSNEGPRNFYGLPGLILKVETKTEIIEATKFEILKTPVEITKPTKGKKVTRKEFETIKAEKIKNLKGNENNKEVQVIKM